MNSNTVVGLLRLAGCVSSLVFLVVTLTGIPVRADIVYVANAFSDSVTVIDADTNKVRATVKMKDGASPVAIAASADRKFVFVANEKEKSIAILETGGNTVVATVAVPSAPRDVLVDPEGAFLYIVHSNGSFSVLDIRDPKNAKLLRVLTEPEAITGINKVVLVTALRDHRIWLAAARHREGMGVVTSTFVQEIQNEKGTDEFFLIPADLFKHLGEVMSFEALAIAPNGRDIAAGFQRRNQPGEVRIVNASTEQSFSVPVGTNPTDIAITPDGKFAYVVAGPRKDQLEAGTVSIIDMSKPKKDTTITLNNVGLNPTKVAISPDGGRAYVLNKDFDVLSVIDTKTKEVTQIKLTGRLKALAITPDGKFAYVTLSRSNQQNKPVGFAARIDVRTNKVTTEVQVGELPGALTVLPTLAPFGDFPGFKGSAKPIGEHGDGSGDAQVKIAGRFGLEGAVGLGNATIVIQSLLNEEEGAGELVRRGDALPALPVMLFARPGGKANAAIYEGNESLRPTFRLEIKNRDPRRGVFEFSLVVDRATIPGNAERCDAGEATTPLTTTLLMINPSVVISGMHEWECLGDELRTP